MTGLKASHGRLLSSISTNYQNSSGLSFKTIPKIYQLWNSDKRYRVAYGGRGSGKSYGIAQYLAARALSENAIILCTRNIQNTLSDSALAVLKRALKDANADRFFEQTRHGLKCLLSGADFIFRGLQYPDRIRSLESIKYCWIEEAQKVTQDAWDILKPTIREQGSEIWVSFNPDQETDPVYQNFVINKRDDAEVIPINYQHNRYFPEVLRREMEWDKAHDYDKYLWIWEGNTRTVSERQVFRGKFRVSAFETPPDVTFYQGADWGFSADPTVLVRMFIKNNILWIDHEAYGVGVDIDDTPALFESVPESAKWLITADSARPETISYMRQHGFPKMRGASKGKGSVEDGIEFIKSFDGVVIHNRCKHAADEFALYSYKEDKLTGDPLPILEDKNNHIVDGTRYALEGMMRRYGSVGNMNMGSLGL